MSYEIMRMAERTDCLEADIPRCMINHQRGCVAVYFVRRDVDI